MHTYPTVDPYCIIHTYECDPTQAHTRFRSFGIEFLFHCLALPRAFINIRSFARRRRLAHTFSTSINIHTHSDRFLCSTGSSRIITSCGDFFSSRRLLNFILGKLRFFHSLLWLSHILILNIAPRNAAATRKNIKYNNTYGYMVNEKKHHSSLSKLSWLSAHPLQ